MCVSIIPASFTMSQSLEPMPTPISNTQIILDSAYHHPRPSRQLSSAFTEIGKVAMIWKKKWVWRGPELRKDDRTGEAFGWE